MDVESPKPQTPCQRAGRVADLMTPQPMVVLPEATVSKVYGLMNDRRIRHVPVVDEEGELLGLVSRWYLLGHVGMDPGRDGSHEVAVESLMSESVDTVEEGCCSAEAARHMLRTKRSSLVVVDTKNRVIGILTEADYLRLAVRGQPPCTCSGVRTAD